MTIPIPDPRPAIGSRWKMCSHMEPGDPGIWETGTLIEYVGDWVRFAMDSGGFFTGPWNDSMSEIKN